MTNTATPTPRRSTPQIPNHVLRNIYGEDAILEDHPLSVVTSYIHGCPPFLDVFPFSGNVMIHYVLTKRYFICLIYTIALVTLLLSLVGRFTE